MSSVATGLASEAVTGVSMDQAEVRVRERMADRSAGLAAFEGVVRRYESGLLRYAAGLLGRGREEAEDIVQEAFLRLHRQRLDEGAASVGDERVWLYRVTHNLVMDVGRKRTRRKRVDEKLKGEAERETTMREREGARGDGGDGGEHYGSNPAASMEKRERVAAAMEELEGLSDEQKQVVLLHVIGGMTMRQVGEVAGVSASNVCYRLKGALEILGRRLRERGVM